ncbi:MAG: hypothetical protein IKN25_02200 [Spirochaetales bacterium]|nr:hypothetical protein [Spirochaetales bacterium]
MNKFLAVCFVLLISSISLFGVTEGRIPSSREMNNTRTEIRRLYNKGEYNSVVTLCKKIVNTYPDDRFAPLYLAYSYERLGQYSSAESIYLRCLKSDAYGDEDVQRIRTNLSNDIPISTIVMPIAVRLIRHSMLLNLQNIICRIMISSICMMPS